MSDARQKANGTNTPLTPWAAAVPTSRSLALPLASPSPSGASVGVPGGTLPPSPSLAAPSVVVVVATRRRRRHRRQIVVETAIVLAANQNCAQIVRRCGRRRRLKMKRSRSVERRIP